MRSVFVGEQVAGEGEGWMVCAIEKCYYCILELKGCVQRNLYLTCASL